MLFLQYGALEMKTKNNNKKHASAPTGRRQLRLPAGSQMNLAPAWRHTRINLAASPQSAGDQVIPICVLHVDSTCRPRVRPVPV